MYIIYNGEQLDDPEEVAGAFDLGFSSPFPADTTNLPNLSSLTGHAPSSISFNTEQMERAHDLAKQSYSGSADPT